MKPQRIFAVIMKEFALVFASWPAWGMIFVPVAALTALLLYILHVVMAMNRSGAPDWLINYFLMFFVAMPALNATKIAASGIMGDKASKSLEPLLATPLTPCELIFGKLLVAVLPPVFMAGVAYQVFIHVAGSWNITEASLFGNIGGAYCLLVMFIMTLLLTNLVALNGFLVASRKTEPRNAVLASTTIAEGILLLPLAGVYYGYKHHVTRGLWATEVIGLLLLANAVLFLFGLALFQRERILFKWK